MRGRIWNFFRALYRKFDFTTENGFLALKRFGLMFIGTYGLAPLVGTIPGLSLLSMWTIQWIVSDPYTWAEFITYLGGNTKNAVGYGKFALQRNDARKIIGDTRNVPQGIYTKIKSKWIEKKNTMSRTSRKRSSVQRKSRKQQSKKHGGTDDYQIGEEVTIREGDKTFPGVIFDFGKATVTVPPYLAATDGEYYYNNFSKSASSKLTPNERFNILKTFFSSDDGGRTLIVDETDFTKNNTTDDILERLKKLKSEIIAAKREELEEQGEMEEERQKTYNKRLVDYNKL